MFTIFTTPKPFDNAVAIRNQTNAIGSWCCLPDCNEVIVFGGEADVIVGLGATYVDCGEGLPRIDELFATAQTLASNDLLVYVNADIILLPNFSRAIAHAAQHFRHFLLVGRRYDVDVNYQIDYDDTKWMDQIGDLVHRRGMLHPPCGKDYFGFRRPLPLHIPPFYAARCVFDNWLLLNAIENPDIAVIDATRAVTVIHCNHPIYDPNFRSDPTYLYNVKLGGDNWNKGHTTDAPWIMTRDFQLRRR